MEISPAFHLTSKDNDAIRPALPKNVDRIRELFSDHEMLVHDDGASSASSSATTLSTTTPVILKMPLSIKIVDTVRYAWMSALGGIYADMDVYFNRVLKMVHPVVLIRRECPHGACKSLFASGIWDPLRDEILKGFAVGHCGVGSRTSMFFERDRSRSCRADHPKTSLSPPVVFSASGPDVISVIEYCQDRLRRFLEIQVKTGSGRFQNRLSQRPSGLEFLVHETAGSCAP